MANTYTQIHLQLVFAVQNRLSLIQPSWKDKLYQYVTGIVQSYNHKLIIINGMTDHLHVVVGMRPTQSISDLLQAVKRDSSGWINKNKLANGPFQWQDGYGAFSYRKADLPSLIKYVETQEIHHHKKTFMEEYKEILHEFGIEYDEKYLFKEIA